MKTNKVLIEENGNGIKGYRTFTKKAAEEILKVLSLGFPVELSILIVDDSIIHDLNKQYRGIDSPTDVLAFPMREGFTMSEPDDIDFHRMLGDVVISIDMAKKQASELNHATELEIANLICHGILHLAGYSDETQIELDKMEQLTLEILDRINIESLIGK